MSNVAFTIAFTQVGQVNLWAGVSEWRRGLLAYVELHSSYFKHEEFFSQGKISICHFGDQR